MASMKAAFLDWDRNRIITVVSVIVGLYAGLNLADSHAVQLVYVVVLSVCVAGVLMAVSRAL